MRGPTIAQMILSDAREIIILSAIVLLGEAIARKRYRFLATVGAALSVAALLGWLAYLWKAWTFGGS